MFEGLLKDFQISLLRKALLTMLVFLSPRPLYFLGIQILTQTTKGKPFSALDFFQKNYLLTYPMTS